VIAKECKGNILFRSLANKAGVAFSGSGPRPVGRREAEGGDLRGKQKNVAKTFKFWRKISPNGEEGESRGPKDGGRRENTIKFYFGPLPSSQQLSSCERGRVTGFKGDVGLWGSSHATSIEKHLLGEEGGLMGHGIVKGVLGGGQPRNHSGTPYSPHTTQNLLGGKEQYK